jgi:Tol biopolymer transport system component
LHTPVSVRSCRVGAVALALVLSASSCGGSSSSNAKKTENGPLALSVLEGTKDHQRGIYRRDPDGRIRRLTSSPVGRDFFPKWSHDGKRIAFLRESRELQQGAAKLFVVNGDGSDAHQVGDVVAAAEQIGWSPDDDSLVYIGTNTKVWTVKADGTGARQIHDEDARDPAWSTSGRIVVAGILDRGLTLLNADGADVHEITHPKKPPRALLPTTQTQPAWSPDGRRIAFVQKVGLPSPKTFLFPTTLDVVNADGTGQKTLTKLFDESGVSLTWSADGRSIAFTDLRGSEPGLWVISSGGGKVHPLLRGTVYSMPSWGPAGA